MKKSKKILLLAGLLLVSGAKVNNSGVLVNTKYNLEELITTPIITPLNFNKIKQNDFFEILKKFEAVESQESLKKEETLEDYRGSIYENMKVSEIISKKFIKSIINVESKGDEYAESKVGARGLMQLMPATWKQIEKELDFYKEAFNPNKNIEVGIKYLNWIHDYCEKKYPKWNELPTKNKQIIISAAYNGGIGRLRKKDWNINKMPEETRNYVKKIEKDLNRNN